MPKIEQFMTVRAFLLSIVFFCITFYWVEFSPWSSKELAKYNDGYGTFDMKRYDEKTVYDVMEQMEPKGIQIYRNYMIGDYLFILAFGIIQMMILWYSYSWLTNKKVVALFLVVPLLRGMFDFVENTLLLIILYNYPKTLPNVVRISSMATQAKLLMIKLWGVLTLLGIVGRLVHPIYSQQKVQK